jgi:hypothetical protein
LVVVRLLVRWMMLVEALWLGGCTGHSVGDKLGDTGTKAPGSETGMMYQRGMDLSGMPMAGMPGIGLMTAMLVTDDRCHGRRHPD